MPEGSDTQGILLQNLMDAGCDDELVRQCMALAKARKRADILRLLSCHKRGLLDAMHGCRQRIVCLDDLMYRIARMNGRLGESSEMGNGRRRHFRKGAQYHFDGYAA